MSPSDPPRALSPLVITIDGPAGSGKSTVAVRVARRLGLPYLNSGAIYRAVTLAALDAGADFDDTARVGEIIAGLDLEMHGAGAEGGTGADPSPRYVLAGKDVTDRLKDPDVTAQVYRVANVPEYRALLVEQQRRFARGDGVVAEGRDMGTVIFPDAQVKIFLDAPAEARARRQWLELAGRGIQTPFEDVLEKVRERDGHDRNRSTAPLVAAPDAVAVDTGEMTIEEVVSRVLEIVRERATDAQRERFFDRAT